MAKGLLQIHPSVGSNSSSLAWRPTLIPTRFKPASSPLILRQNPTSANKKGNHPGPDSSPALLHFRIDSVRGGGWAGGGRGATVTQCAPRCGVPGASTLGSAPHIDYNRAFFIFWPTLTYYCRRTLSTETESRSAVTFCGGEFSTQTRRRVFRYSLSSSVVLFGCVYAYLYWYCM